MARAKLNPLIESLQGRIGDVVFKRYGEKIVVSKKPEFTNRKFTKAQKKFQERFRNAATYGKRVLADPVARQAYEKAAKASGKPILSVMIADFLHEPIVEGIDLNAYTGKAGESIVVHATDDFAVVRVTVAIADASGNEVECNEAVYTRKDVWTYTCSVTTSPGLVTISATAFDKPGHSTTLRREFQVA